MRVLALNPGSSSLKAAARDERELELQIEIERIGTAQARLEVDGTDAGSFVGTMADAVVAVGALLDERALAPDVVAHRIVHGGPKHPEHTVVDDALVADLRDAVPLAPLHLPGALDMLVAARRRWPDATHVACFDTAFFRDLPEAAIRLPVPGELVDAGVRRYGFHGLSVGSVIRRHPELGDVVVAHLGSGCSVSAVDADGRPRHTTMSMTPTGGMVSGTRTGDLDPEIVLFLVEQRGYSIDRLRELFNHDSGLAGVAGGRHDLRDLLSAGDHDAELAVELFVRSAAMSIAACATTLDDWRTLVFTGGIGEHAEATRAAILARVRPPGTVQVRVVPADEEGELDLIARGVYERARQDSNLQPLDP